MQAVQSNYGKLVKYLNQQSKNFKSISVIASKLKLQGGELLLILLSILATLIILDVLTHTLVTFFGMMYPTYATFKAIKNEDYEERHKWLSFWVIFGFFTAFDRPLHLLIGWIPFYYSLKLVFYVLLVHPKTNYAEKIYDRIIKPQTQKIMRQNSR